MLTSKKQKETINKYYKNFINIFLIIIIAQSLTISSNASRGIFRTRYFDLESKNKLYKLSSSRQSNSFIPCKRYVYSQSTLYTKEFSLKRTIRMPSSALNYQRKAYLSTFQKDEYFHNLSLPEIDSNIPILTNFLEYTLNKNGYNMLGAPKSVVSKISRILSVVETETGKKFVKLSNVERATQEYNGGKKLAKYLPTIETDIISLRNIGLLIRPFIEINESLNFLGEITGKIQLYKRERLPLYFSQIFDPLFEQALTTSMLTIEQSKKQALNDYLFYDKLKTWKKDKEKGRIEEYYAERPFYLDGKIIDWDKLVLKKWTINGITYK